MDFGQPNVEIGRKMASDQLLFLALEWPHLNADQKSLIL